MVIGKTFPSLTIEELFSKYSEIDILTTYFNIKEIPCCINSPLRQDSRPSFSIYLNNDKKIRYIDFATGEHGGLIDLLCHYWHCSLSKALSKIYNDSINSSTIKPSNKIKVFTKQEKDKLSKVEVKVRPWETFDFEYWRSYGIEPKFLKYAEIYPISHKIVTKKNPITNVISRYVFKADRYAYVFVERKERRLQLKIYQPYNTNGYKWSSKMDGSVISLWTKIPQEGDKVIICSSLKDALCVSCQLGIPTLALQGEGYSISETAINELKRRYKRVYISFDTDIPGIQDANKLALQTGFINVVPNLGNQKDYSDYYKSLENKSDFQSLKLLFN